MFGKIQHKSTKGYAFIRSTQTAKDAPVQDLFMHHTAFLGDWDKLVTGDLVEYLPGIRKGNPIALDVRLLAEPTEEVSSGVARDNQ
jgi:cold shock CspA family protein